VSRLGGSRVVGARPGAWSTAANGPASGIDGQPASRAGRRSVRSSRGHPVQRSRGARRPVPGWRRRRGAGLLRRPSRSSASRRRRCKRTPGSMVCSSPPTWRVALPLRAARDCTPSDGSGSSPPQRPRLTAPTDQAACLTLLLSAVIVYMARRDQQLAIEGLSSTRRRRPRHRLYPPT